MYLQRVSLAQGNCIDHGVIVEVTSQRAKQIPEVGLGEGITKTVGEGQQPSAVLQELEDRANFRPGEQEGGGGFPALFAGIVAPSGWRQHQQAAAREFLPERRAVGGEAQEAKVGEMFVFARKISEQLAGGEAGLRPVGLAVAGIEEDNGNALDWR